jgi:putrescine transport system substrate-binding protein
MASRYNGIVRFDMFAIPRDVPHPTNARAFLNYMMTPQVIADVSNATQFAYANLASQPFLLPVIRASIHRPRYWKPERHTRRILPTNCRRLFRCWGCD